MLVHLGRQACWDLQNMDCHSVEELGFTSLVTKEMQIKTILRFHLTPVRMAIFKGNKNNKCW
jgi:hypothetical protein